MYKTKCLVTGCVGFVGSRICARLIDLGIDVYGIDNLSFGSRENIPEGLAWMDKDFNEAGARFLNDFDVLVHCAVSNIIYAQTHETETFSNNALHAINLFQKFRGKIIFTSTASVYNSAEEIPTPEHAKIHCVNSYDTSKRISEMYLQERGNYTTIRLSNVTGINQRPSSEYCGVVGKMIHSAIKGESIKIIGDGKQTRDFTYVEDVVDAVMRCIELPAMNDEYNIATGIETSIIDLSKMICSALDRPHSIQMIPKRSIDGINRRCLDISKAEKILGWSPKTNIKLGILKTIEWQKTI